MMSYDSSFWDEEEWDWMCVGTVKYGCGWGKNDETENERKQQQRKFAISVDVYM